MSIDEMSGDIGAAVRGGILLGATRISPETVIAPVNP